MGDTFFGECECCGEETDLIMGKCEECSMLKGGMVRFANNLLKGIGELQEEKEVSK